MHSATPEQAASKSNLNMRARNFRVLVRDNGCGIDSQVLQAGREGHWGLAGMRERARDNWSSPPCWSSPRSGTEVELSVPSHIAFRV